MLLQRSPISRGGSTSESVLGDGVEAGKKGGRGGQEAEVSSGLRSSTAESPAVNHPHIKPLRQLASQDEAPRELEWDYSGAK